MVAKAGQCNSQGGLGAAAQPGATKADSHVVAVCVWGPQQQLLLDASKRKHGKQLSDDWFTHVASSRRTFALSCTRLRTISPCPPCPLQVLLRLLKQVSANSLGIEVDKETLQHVAQLATSLFNKQSSNEKDWTDVVVPYLTPFFGDEGAEGVCRAMLGRCVGRCMLG